MADVISHLNPLGWSSSEERSLLPDAVRWRLVGRPRFWRPPADVYETEDSVILRVEIAGMREEDFTISLEGQRLLVEGFRTDTSERRAYHQIEIPFGEFALEVELPVPVIAQKVEALYQDGFLRIILPKDIPRQIHIKD